MIILLEIDAIAEGITVVVHYDFTCINWVYDIPKGLAVKMLNVHIHTGEDLAKNQVFEPNKLPLFQLEVTYAARNTARDTVGS